MYTAPTAKELRLHAQAGRTARLIVTTQLAQLAADEHEAWAVWTGDRPTRRRLLWRLHAWETSQRLPAILPAGAV